MKKTILLLAVSAAFFAGCTNENSENPIATGPVIIRGNLLGDIVGDDPGDDEDVTNELISSAKLQGGTKLIVYVRDEDSGVLLGQVETTTGTYEITVQVGEPRDLDIYVGDFLVNKDVLVGPDPDDFEAKLHRYDDGDDEGESINDAQRGVTYLKDIILTNFTLVEFDN